MFHHGARTRRLFLSAAAGGSSLVAASLLFEQRRDRTAMCDPAPGAAAADPAPMDPAAKWAQVLKQAVPAVVSLKVNIPIGFDTGSAGCSQATGFVVDAKRGKGRLGLGREGAVTGRHSRAAADSRDH
jgi:hypothetical protein